MCTTVLRAGRAAALAFVAAGWGPSAVSAQQAGGEAQLVWPAPPEVARVRFVSSLATEADIGRKESFMRRVRRAVVGGSVEGTLRVQRPYDVFAWQPERIYVSDGLTQALLLFDRTRREAELVGLDVPGGLQKPAGIGPGPAGGLMVADQGGRRAVQLDSAGHFVRTFGGPHLLVNPVDAAADTATGLVYVVDSYLHQVVVFDAGGEVVRRLGRQDVEAKALAQAAEQPARPTHETPGGGTSESVGPHRAQTRDALNNRGEGEGEFKYPYSVAVAGDGTVYVSDQMNFRVLAFDRGGSFLRQIGEVGTQPGQFARPKGVAVDAGGRLYVVDAAFNNVQIFEPSGRLLLAFGGGGSGAGLQILPLGLAIDASQRIYVTDRFNNRIQVYQYVGPDAAGGAE